MTEDSGDDAFDTFKRVARELLKQVDEYINTHPERLAFEPLRSTEALQALNGSIWKSRAARDRQKQVTLIGTIATQLMLENGWALFHVDGDRTWADRSSSENVQKFRPLVWEKVRLRILMELEQREKQTANPTTPSEREARANQRMTRLKQVVPFYSMEAWLFQNTREAVRLCAEHYRNTDVERFNAWEQDRTALDEVLEPKKKVCLGAKHNLELASQGFPARAVHDAGKSFAAVVQELSQDEELTEALSRTYAYE
ncbi:hypothetical protein [Pyxidicoccus trucidator]|uniref:hypothetical protein n=1 Tax=Pyxidicoccus trucidator TaxID=2709662 RepID=UPI0013DA7A58|nr:hypothetical protein [Pyxidicoccus trucidator]